MILGPMRFVIPTQLPVVEQGAAGGLPVANQVFISQWHDCYRPHVENIIVTQTGASVSTGDTTNLPDTLLRFTGMYFLDIFVLHSNAAALPMLILIDNAIASALAAPGFAGLGGFVYTVQSAVPFSASVRLTSRLFRIRWTYANDAALSFGFCTVLRAA